MQNYILVNQTKLSSKSFFIRKLRGGDYKATNVQDKNKAYMQKRPVPIPRKTSVTRRPHCIDLVLCAGTNISTLLYEKGTWWEGAKKTMSTN